MDISNNYDTSRQIAYPLKLGNINARGWLLDVLSCINQIQTIEFTLDDVYLFEEYLSLKHPANNNVKAKIRQQLQVLRDRHVIEFIMKGVYRKTL